MGQGGGGGAFGSNSKCDRKPLKNFRKGSNMMGCIF